MGGELPFDLRLDGGPVESYSTYSAAAGGRVLTIATVLPDHRLAFELISTYVGHAEVSGHVTHLALGPIGYSPSIEHVEDQLDPAADPRACAYDHAHQLIEALSALGPQATVEVDERTFAALERVE